MFSKHHKMHQKIIGIAAISFGIILNVWAFDFSAYPMRKISEMMLELPPPNEESIVIDARFKKFSSQVTYNGVFEEIDAEKKNFIKEVFASFGLQKFSRLFIHEMLVEQDGKLYHIPVQEPLIPSFRKETKPGDRIVLYMNFLGYYNVDSQPVMTVNEFFVSP